MILIGLMRLLQALLIKLLPLYLAGVAVVSYWPNQNAVAFAWLGFAWWTLGPKFRGVAGVRWRAGLSALLFCIAISTSGYLFIELWRLSWAGFWILLLTGSTMVAVHEQAPKLGGATASPATAPVAMASVVTASSYSHAFRYVGSGFLLVLAVSCLLIGIAFLDQSISAVIEPRAETIGPRGVLDASLRVAQELNGMNFAVGIGLLAVGLLGLNRSLRRSGASEGPIDRLMGRRWVFGKTLGAASWPAAPAALFAVAAAWLCYQSLIRTQFHFSAPAAVEAFKDVNGELGYPRGSIAPVRLRFMVLKACDLRTLSTASARVLAR